MKRPSFQFYPADWKQNSKLRRCSEAARGAWLDIMGILHDSDEYGVCRWPLADLARAAGVSLKSARELAEKDVLKGADRGASPYIFTPSHAGKAGEPVTLVEAKDGPCWYSSRLVRDEWVRQRRGQATQFTPENQPPKPEPKATPKQTPKPPIGDLLGDGPSSSSSSSSSSAKETITPRAMRAEFEEGFWPICPKKVGKELAFKAYAKARRTAEAGAIVAGMRGYAASRAGQDDQFTAHPSTWLNAGRWNDETGASAAAAQSTVQLTPESLAASQAAEEEFRRKKWENTDAH